MLIEQGSKWRWKGDDGAFFTKGRVYVALSNGKPGEMFMIEDDLRHSGSPHHWTNDASFFERFERVDGPVRTVTRKEIVDGTYGELTVSSYDDTRARIHLVRNILNAEEVRAAAATLIEIADALESETTA